MANDESHGLIWNDMERCASMKKNMRCNYNITRRSDECDIHE